jgi:transporter family-2 protein
VAVGNFGWLLIVAAIGGIVVALQAQFIGLMDQHLGTLESVFITYVGGGLLILFVMLVSGGGNLLDWRSVPWYALSAGATGLVIIGALSYTVPRLGLVPAFTIFVASQFMTGAVLDHFGWLGATARPLDLFRLAGIAVMLLGVWLTIRQ